MTDWRRLLSPIPNTPSDAAAAVLVLLSDTPDVVFVRKTDHLEHHAGQVAFPGGMRERSDSTIAATAVREAQEEVGVDPREVRVLGLLPQTLQTAIGTRVAVVIGEWSGESNLRCADEFEVSEVFRVPLAELAAKNNRVTAKAYGQLVGPAFLVAGHFIWGFTGYTIAKVLQLTGWDEPWNEQRTLPVPAAYLGQSGQTRASG